MVDNKNISRRGFLKTVVASGAVVAASSVGCKSPKEEALAQKEVPTGEMTYRLNNKGEKISILGYGCMRLPTKKVEGTQDETVIDQDMVNRHVDYALEHGVNYFDTSPAYCKGKSEAAMGIALSRHDRNKYYIATKLSNFAKSTWSYKESVKMYHKSFEELQVEYIDYMLLHGIGMGGMENLKARYLDNGVLDFLLKEREVGKIRNLGFSYHGDVECFDYLLAHHDKYKWDFVQIQMNYIDWKHAARDANAEYLYAELEKRGIPVVIMEPLRGGALANVNYSILAMLKRENPEASAASWAFRYAGTPKGILTVLSGMTYMEHLQENIRTYSPLVELTEKENEMMLRAGEMILNYPLIGCTGCQYCMPCPYGIDIPAIFTHYNKCINEGNFTDNINDDNYAKARKAFLVGYDRSVPKLRQADHCIGCQKCEKHCPQSIPIAKNMRMIDKYVESIKRNEKA
ncbi:MAG: aldo/keto reductase [Muribaculaceae bacterium]|nr:aldo/keto reductase [Muribaculaceae bacterium]MEE1337374.1 aldo/keto reductase [Muribaculaceae bacterium]